MFVKKETYQFNNKKKKKNSVVYVYLYVRHSQYAPIVNYCT